MRRALGFAFVASACVACAVITSLDDLGRDGGADAIADGATEAAPDAANVDAGTDASDAPYCKQADHSLCDDFDELPLGALWTSQHVTTATLAFDDDAAVSPPHSLFAAVETSQGGSAYLQKDFTGSASRVTCQFDARMDAVQGVPILSFSLGLASTDPSRPDYNVTLLHTSAKTTYSEWTGSADGGGGSNTVDMLALPANWTHVTIDLNFAGSSATIFYGASSVLAQPLTAPPNSGQTLLLGVIEYSATVGAMHFDNVACDLTP